MNDKSLNLLMGTLARVEWHKAVGHLAAVVTLLGDSEWPGKTRRTNIFTRTDPTAESPEWPGSWVMPGQVKT